jgi:flagellin-specific chaperone FliS
MSERAAQIARTLMEEWFPEKETASCFLERKFPADTTEDLNKAADIMEELVRADNSYSLEENNGGK